MKVRNKEKGYTGVSGSFNTHALSEIIVGFDDGPNGEPNGADSCFISEYDVFLEETQKWKDMRQAFKDHDLINDNYNTVFFEPKTKEDRERGFTL